MGGVDPSGYGYAWPMALHEILPNTLMAPREARIAIARFLSKAQLSQLTDDAQLLASELVTNAVRHASGPIDVRAYVRDGFLRLEVGDSCVDCGPQPRPATPEDEGGRGMEIVDKLSARWGWRARGHVKVVWLDLPMPTASTPRT
jgi:anti-sigma regulatory factor (Ser/Thr protein kinase)